MFLLYAGFVILVLLLLALDLGVLNRKPHVIGVGEALRWTAFWIFLALVFNVAIYFLYDHHVLGLGTADPHERTAAAAATKFLTGYLVEKSLSMDNLFVIALIFQYFKVPALHQHRVLFWGVVGALAMRGVMIALGSALVQSFGWINYVFGALLIYTAAKMLLADEDEFDPEQAWAVRAMRKLYPVATEYDGNRFFTTHLGRRAMTPLMLVLVLVETTDVMFAVDSIPAIFALTHDPFLVFTSNIFAILGLRSLFFALAGMMDKFRYLKASLVFVLAFIGAKMLATHALKAAGVELPSWLPLLVIVTILAVGVLASIMHARREARRAAEAAGSRWPGASPGDGDADGTI